MFKRSKLNKYPEVFSSDVKVWTGSGTLEPPGGWYDHYKKKKKDEMQNVPYALTFLGCYKTTSLIQEGCRGPDQDQTSPHGPPHTPAEISSSLWFKFVSGLIPQQHHHHHVTLIWRVSPSPQVQVSVRTLQALGWLGRRTASSVWTLKSCEHPTVSTRWSWADRLHRMRTESPSRALWGPEKPRFLGPRRSPSHPY